MIEKVNPLTALSIRGLIFIVVKEDGKHWYKHGYDNGASYDLGPHDSIEECIENANTFGF